MCPLERTCSLLRLLGQVNGRVELLVRAFDCVALQCDLGAELVAAATSEQAAPAELALRRREFLLGAVTSLGEHAALPL